MSECSSYVYLFYFNNSIIRNMCSNPTGPRRIWALILGLYQLRVVQQQSSAVWIWKREYIYIYGRYYSYHLVTKTGYIKNNITVQKHSIKIKCFTKLISIIYGLRRNDGYSETKEVRALNLDANKTVQVLEKMQVQENVQVQKTQV